MAPNLAASQHDMIRDMIMSKSLKTDQMADVAGCSPRSVKAIRSNLRDTLTSVSQLGSVLESQGKYEEAEVMHRRALKRYEKVLGAEHPDTLTSVSNLASTFWSQKRLKEAEKLELQVMVKACIQLQKRILGPYPNTESSLEALNEWQMENIEMEL